MMIRDLKGRQAMDVDFEEMYKNFRFRQLSRADDEAALKKVEEVREANANVMLEVMDKHNEMVKKSQELNRIRARRRAVEQRYEKQREEQTRLLGEVALRNAERRQLLEAARLK